MARVVPPGLLLQGQRWEKVKRMKKSEFYIICFFLAEIWSCVEKSQVISTIAVFAGVGFAGLALFCAIFDKRV